MNRIPSVLLVMITVIIYACSDNQRPQYQPVTEFDPERDAENDIELAMAEAQRSQRNIILDVGGEWCIWCHRLDTFIENHPHIAEFMEQNYVVVKVNYSPENKNETVLSRYPKIPGYPHLFVLDSQGNLIHSQGTAELEQNKGYDQQKVMSFLKNWVIKKEI